jgi:hypothetical protein
MAVRVAANLVQEEHEIRHDFEASWEVIQCLMHFKHRL